MKLNISRKAGPGFTGKKLVILISIIPFLAASCGDDIFNFGGGNRGIFKSEDAAQTFIPKNKLLPKGDIANLSINSIAFDPTSPEILYVASGTGIYKSEDGAENFSYVLSGITVSSVAVDPASPATIFAAGLSGKRGKILKSTDSGTTWVDIYNEPSENNTVLSIAISRSNSSLVLAGLNNGEIIRSTDAGKTWQVMTDFADRVVTVKFGLAGAYALTGTKGLFKSADSGLTWSSITSPLTDDSINSSNQNFSSVTAFFDLALDNRQTGVLYLGTEQGIFRTVNEGQNWAFLSLPVRNAALRVTGIAVSPSNPNHIFAAVSSTVYKSTNGGLTWETKVLPTSAVVRMIVINPQSANVMYLGLRSQ